MSLRLLPLMRTSSQAGDADYQFNTLLLLCPVVACDDGSPFYMRGEEEVFCSNADLQFTFEGAIFFHFVCSRSSVYRRYSGSHYLRCVYIAEEPQRETSRIVACILFSLQFLPTRACLNKYLTASVMLQYLASPFRRNDRCRLVL